MTDTHSLEQRVAAARHTLASAESEVIQRRNWLVECEAKLEEAKRAEAAKIPVDRNARELASGQPVPEDGSHTAKKDNGQQKDYVILSEAERAKGFVRPVRRSYLHVGPPKPGPMRDLTEEEKARYPIFVKYETYPDDGAVDGRYWTQKDLDRLNLKCDALTTMSQAIAETYARDPKFYGGTFCCACGDHFPVGEKGEFVWEDGSRVGT